MNNSYVGFENGKIICRHTGDRKRWKRRYLFLSKKIMIHWILRETSEFQYQAGNLEFNLNRFASQEELDYAKIRLRSEMENDKREEEIKRRQDSIKNAIRINTTWETQADMVRIKR